MPTIVFASPKGGVGKTTSAFVVATELADRGLSVAVLDADPNHPIANWQKRGGKADNLSIYTNESEETILDDIDKAVAKSDFVIIDLEGTANLSVAYAISRADLVVVPTQRSTLDAGEAVKAVALAKRQSSVIGRDIPVRLLLTRTSQAIRSKGLKRMMESITKNNIDVFGTELHEREAFKAIFDHTVTLSQLKPTQVSGLDKARLNASSLTAEIIVKLKKNPAKKSQKQKETV